MKHEFVKERAIQEKKENDTELELIKCIFKVKDELNNATKNFEFAEDELVDYYTYQIKANQSKLDYLIRQAKTKGISVDMIKKIKIKISDEEMEAV